MTVPPEDIIGNCELCDMLIHCDSDWFKDEIHSDVFFHTECFVEFMNIDRGGD
jgi:hypothetical protein